MKRRIVGVISSLAILGLLSGCAVGAQASHGVGDSSINQQGIDRSAANVIEFPDTFGNIAWKCFPGHVVVMSNTNHMPFKPFVDATACPNG